MPEVLLARTSAVDAALGRGALRVAVKFHPSPEEGFAPEYYRDPSTGRPSGVVCELMRLMAADLGVDPEPEWIEICGVWQDQFDALHAGDVDLVPKPTNTPRRALSVEFAGRLLNYDVLALVRQSSPFQTIHDVNRPDVRVAFTRGSSNEFVCRRHFPTAQMVPTELKADVIDEDTADVFVSAPIARRYLELKPHLRALRERDGRLVVLSSEYAHPAVRLGDQRFLNWINNWLAYHEAQGTLGHWWEWWRASLLQ